MNLSSIDWNMVMGVVAILSFIYWLHRISKRNRKEHFDELRRDVYEEFENVDRRFQEIDGRFEKIDLRFESMEVSILTLSRNIGSDMSDIKERLAFLESAALYTMPIEPTHINPRSQAAREMWKRRKAKKIEKRD